MQPSGPRRLQHKLFIGNIAESVTRGDLERAFSRFGRIQETWVARNPPGFGFVEFERRRDAIEALQVQYFFKLLMFHYVDMV